MNTLFNTLKEMGFVAHNGGMMWGCGAWLSQGTYLKVAHKGKGYKVAYHSWCYDQYGDLVFEERVEQWFRRHSEVINLVIELKRK